VLFNNRDGFPAGRADEAGDIVSLRLLAAVWFGPHHDAIRADDGPSMSARTARPVEQNKTALQRMFNANYARRPALRTALRDLENDRLGNHPLEE
jgi:hypothetical protein